MRRAAARAVVWGAALLAGCTALPTPQERLAGAQALANARGWQQQVLDAGPFMLAAWSAPAVRPSPRLVVYIEGDGLAWRTGTQPSDDPTPVQPMALTLALAQPADAGTAVAVLARPCQYVSVAQARNCGIPAWTSHRFSAAAVAATQRALDQLKERHGAAELVLVGYSGGGAIAALAAAGRSDVAALVTVAGNLDHAAWTRRHRVLPLDGSLNAADAAGRLAGLPQVHLAGQADAIVSPADIQHFIDRFPPGRRPALRVVAGFDHACCWAQQWPALWRDAQSAWGQPAR